MSYLLFVTGLVYQHESLSGCGGLHLVIVLDVLIADGTGGVFGETMLFVESSEIGLDLFFFQSVKPPRFV
jgi:hypothetical protein